MKKILFGMLVAATSFAPVGAFAACYDYQVVPASVDCSGGHGNGSADFGANCVEVQTSLVQITIDCPVVASAAPSTTKPTNSTSAIFGREDRDSRAGNQMSGGGGFGSPH